MNIVIRKADQNDLELLQEFGIKTFRDSFEKFNTKENMKVYLDKNFSLEKIQQELSHLQTEFLLAFIEEQIAGYAKIISNKNVEGLSEESALEIERIYVDHKFHGKHVGKALLDRSFMIAKEKGIKVVWLGVWEHNPRAIAFYRKWGFEKFGEHEFMLGSDVQNDWLMKKILL